MFTNIKIEVLPFLCLNQNTMREFELKNNISAVVKRNKNTPRIALALNFSINKSEKKAGQYLLMNRLLLKGTKKYSSKEKKSILRS